MAKFKVGDVVKLISDVGLYTFKNLYGHERLELDKDYTVYSVENNGEFIRLIKDSGETEGVFSYRLIHAEPETTAESLRNFILDIRSKREALQKEILQLDEQEKESVEKLKELGFVLYEGNVSKEPVVTEKKVVLYAEDIEEDMTNPGNWEVGDLFVRCEGKGTDYFEAGDNIRLIDKDVEDEDEFYLKYEYLDESDYWYVKTENVKFHSRPVK